MANQQGFSAADGMASIAKICAHYDRSKMFTEAGELRYQYYPNLTQRGKEKTFNQSEIDPSRTHLNYNLAPEHVGGQVAFIERRLGEVYVHKTALKNAMVDWVVTLPDMEQYQGREREFFEQVYRFLERRYGAENVVSAYVHYDERQPHMHFAFLPIAPDEKHEQGWKLSKKAVNTSLRIDEKTLTHKADTKNFSKDLHEQLGRHIEVTMKVERSGIELTDEQRQKRTIKENAKSPSELREASAKLEQIAADTAKAKKDYATQVEIFEIVAKLTRDRQAEKEQLEQSLADLRGELATDQAQLDNVRSEARRLAPEVEKARAEVKAWEDGKAEREAVIQAQKAQIEDQSYRLTALVGDVQELTDQKEELTRDTNKAAKHLENLKGQVDDAVEAMNRTENYHRQLNERVSRLEQVWKRIEEKISHVAELVDSMKHLPFWGEWRKSLQEVMSRNPLAQRVFEVGKPWDTQKDRDRAEKAAKKEIQAEGKSIERDMREVLEWQADMEEWQRQNPRPQRSQDYGRDR